jgi:hypothetical protein
VGALLHLRNTKHLQRRKLQGLLLFFEGTPSIVGRRSSVTSTASLSLQFKRCTAIAEGHSEPIQLYNMVCRSSLRGCGMVDAQAQCPVCRELHPLLLTYRPICDSESFIFAQQLTTNRPGMPYHEHLKKMLLDLPLSMQPRATWITPYKCAD